MKTTAEQQSQHQETGSQPSEQDVGAATSGPGISPSVPATASTPATAGQGLSSADMVKAATKALSAVGSGGRGAGSSLSSGLMIDGFLVPPHVLQALQVCASARKATQQSDPYIYASTCMHACAWTHSAVVAVSWPLHRHSTAVKCSEPGIRGVYPGVSHAWPCNVQRLDLQELRLQAGRSPGAAPPEPALQDILAAAAPQAVAKSAEGVFWNLDFTSSC